MRRGFTVVEVLIGIAITALLIAVLSTFLVSGAMQSGRSLDESDALRSALIATETIRQDVRRMLFQDPMRDLGIPKDRPAASFRVPRALSPDFWNMTHDPVTYELEKIPRTEVNRLMRKTDRGTSPVADCYLREMAVRLKPPGEISKLQAYLELNLVAVESPEARARYVSTTLLPLYKIEEPPGFPMGATP